jgi:hypothetical protein
VALVVLVVLALVALAVSPLSPFSPFGDDPDEHTRVPVEQSAAPTTVPQARDRKYPEAPVAPPIPVPEVPPTTVAPPPAAGTDPGPAPGTPGAPPAPTPAPIAGAGYQAVYGDEFTGLDTSVWQTAPFGGSLPPVVADGTMTLRATADNGHSWGYVASTGPRNPSGEPSYAAPRAWQQGYFEARLRYTDDEWSWPAFWLFSMAKSEAWVRNADGEDCSLLNSEWDIMENGVQNGEGLRPAGDWYFTALHRNTSDNSADDRYCGVADETRTHSQEFPGVDLSGWHTWGALWTGDQLCTYLDDVQIQCMEPYDSTAQPMHLIFTMQYLSRCDGCGPRPSELEIEVDWVRVWQR